MKRRMILLCAGQDRERLSPVLEQLAAKGVSVSGKRNPGKDDIILAVLSERFYADGEMMDWLLGLIGAGAENVLPLQMDGVPVPDTLKNALYARNIIPAAGREPEQIAERIISALPKRKNPLPLLLGAAGIFLLAVAGFLIFRAAGNREEKPAAAQNGIAIPASLGLTDEDLSAIRAAVIVGDRVAFFRDGDERDPGDWPHAEAVAYLDESVSHGEDVRWYSNETGQQLGMTRYDDLRFLGVLPNLSDLTLVLVEADREALPDLRESSSLRNVQVLSCGIDSLDWLAGSSVEVLAVRFTPVSDFGVLTECARLDSLTADMYGLPVRTDFSAFAPPALNVLWLWHANPGGELDLSALSDCGLLSSVTFGNLPLTDLTCLSGSVKLANLQLSEMRNLKNLSGLEGLPVGYLSVENSNALADISAVSGLKKLTDLYIGYCPRIRDYSPIAGCEALEKIHLQCDYAPDAVRDASFLAQLPKLKDIGLYSCNLRNMDFLKGIAENLQASGNKLSLGFAGDILDYSGLAAISRFAYLHVNPRYNNTMGRGGDFSAVFPYIRNAEIDYLMLYSCRGVDLSTLPDGIRTLSIRYGDLTDLTGLKPYRLGRLELWDCQYLLSLSGIESISTLFEEGNMNLIVVGCPRLTDYTALDGARLEGLELTGVYALPDLSKLRTHYLLLDRIPGLSDLHVLDGMNGGERMNLSLTGLDSLYDLTPLKNLSGDHLLVPPQVADQAEELVRNGNFRDFEIAYPDGGWQPFEGAVELLSLDELETLPDSMLMRVERLCIAGDTLIDPEEGDVRMEKDDSGAPALMLYSRETGEAQPVGYGEGTVTDIGIFSGLTGLRELTLFAQPLQDLNGIQNLSALESFRAEACERLSDASALFALQGLTEISLRGTSVGSLQGIQNLYGLRHLDIADTSVTDLAVLTELPELETVTVSAGMKKAVSSLNGKDFRFEFLIEE